MLYNRRTRQPICRLLIRLSFLIYTDRFGKLHFDWLTQRSIWVDLYGAVIIYIYERAKFMSSYNEIGVNIEIQSDILTFETRLHYDYTKTWYKTIPLSNCERMVLS